VAEPVISNGQANPAAKPFNGITRNGDENHSVQNEEHPSKQKASTDRRRKGNGAELSASRKDEEFDRR
jgi:hypothetical protein